MASLFRDDKQSLKPVSQSAAASIVIHALLFAIVIASAIHLRHVVVLRPVTAGSAASQVSMVALSRGALAAAITPPQHHAPPKVKTPAPRAMTARAPQPAPSTPAAPSTQPSSAEKSNPGITGSGDDAQSMYPAYPTVSPSPEVRDRSLLPPTDQRIIVDVNLSANGQVQQARLVSGLGNALDQIVLDTVRGWQFHPAMVNGSPVPSSMELVFPFNRNYPVSG